MKKLALTAAAIVLAAGSAFAQGSPMSGPNSSDRPATWQIQPLDSADFNSAAGVTPRYDGGGRAAAPAAETPVYNGLGSGTDNGQYISVPPIVYGK